MLKRLRYVILFAVPALFAAVFYLVVPRSEAFAAGADRLIGEPWRLAAGTVTARLPFALVEVLAAVLIISLLYIIVRMILPHGRKRALRGLVAWCAVVAYGAVTFLWVWCPAYFAPPLYTDVLTGRGITVAELTAAAELFREGANRTASAVPRSSDGDINISVQEIIRQSTGVFDNLSAEFPRLGRSTAVPKRLIISALMSRTGYTGIYFALTGEANLNTQMPRELFASTMAHELAHSRGVTREDAANFFGIAACVTSDIPIFEYSGYLDGLIHLGNALYKASPSEYYAFSASYSDLVRNDLKNHSDYWTAIAERNEASPVMSAVSTAVNTAYDGFLRSNGQEEGLRTYGECVDLIVEWIVAKQ